MDFKVQNDIDRAFYNKDFTPVKKLLSAVRESLISGSKIDAAEFNLSDIINFDNKQTFVYITLFQEGQNPIRWGSCRSTLSETINRDIEKIRQYKTFKKFDLKNPDKCRILFEYIYETTPADINNIKTADFNPERFEPGITGIKIVLNGKPVIYMPSDAWVNSQMDRKSALNAILRKTYIKDLTNSISERIRILKKTPHQAYIVKSRAFVTYHEDILPLYRGNILYQYSPDEIIKQAMAGADWILEHQMPDGKYLYYYDAKEDNYVDHEHPTRPLDNLYYNDLRHCGGIVCLIRAYQLTKDKKYLEGAKRGIEFSIKLTAEHE